MGKVRVTTLLSQDLDVPEGADKAAVLEFLAQHQSFRDAFCGVSADGFTIVDIEVIEESIE